VSLLLYNNVSLIIFHYRFFIVHLLHLSETRYSPIYDRLSMNKSPFIHKKHQRQYEFRSYVKTFTIPNLTGCTANVFLEYIQRNLPGGVHMIVNQHRVESLPAALQDSVQLKP
ncbi:unnamed protein product, partial [Hymenolepis diminuta]